MGTKVKKLLDARQVKKLTAFLLAFVMVFSAFLGYMPTVAKAGIDDIYLTPRSVLNIKDSGEYFKTFKPTSNVEHSSNLSQGATFRELASSVSQGMDSDPFGKVLTSADKGNIWVRYNGISSMGGYDIDVKVTAVDFNLASSNNKFIFSTKRPGMVAFRGVNNVQLKFDFYISGTNTHINYKGYMTFGDIDANQRITFDGGKLYDSDGNASDDLGPSKVISAISYYKSHQNTGTKVPDGSRLATGNLTVSGPWTFTGSSDDYALTNDGTSYKLSDKNVACTAFIEAGVFKITYYNGGTSEGSQAIFRYEDRALAVPGKPGVQKSYRITSPEKDDYNVQYYGSKTGDDGNENDGGKKTKTRVVSIDPDDKSVVRYRIAVTPGEDDGYDYEKQATKFTVTDDVNGKPLVIKPDTWQVVRVNNSGGSNKVIASANDQSLIKATVSSDKKKITFTATSSGLKSDYLYGRALNFEFSCTLDGGKDISDVLTKKDGVKDGYSVIPNEATWVVNYPGAPYDGKTKKAYVKYKDDGTMPSPAKKVGPIGQTYGQVHLHGTDDTAYDTDGKVDEQSGKVYEYYVYQKLTSIKGTKLSKFEFTDTIDDCFDIVPQDGKAAKIVGSTTSNSTDKFTINQSGNTVTATATAAALADSKFCNQNYSMRIRFKLKDGYTASQLEAHGHTFKTMTVNGKDVECCIVDNKATRSFTRDDGTTPTGEKATEETNISKVRFFKEEPPAEPTGLNKYVGQKGVSLETAEKHDSKDSAYQIHNYDEFDYLLSFDFNKNGTRYDTVRLTDTLEECLDIDNVNKVSITDVNDNLVTSLFDISISEDNKGAKTITASATKEALANPGFASGQQYTMHMTVHRKRTDDVVTSMQEWIDDNGYTFHIPNKGNLYTKTTKGGEDEAESNESWVTDNVNCDLKIEKTCIPYDGWEVGSEVEYAVKVTQIRQDGYAVNVVVEDNTLPEGLKLIPGTIKVSDTHLSEGTIANVEPLETNGWRATCPRLQYGDYFVVSFKAKASEAVNGSDTINTATAIADNFFKEDNETPKSISDSAEVWVNTPNITVNKYSDKYEYEVGDTVHYTVEINNTKDYTVAKNLVVEDVSLPQGMQLATGDNAVRVTMSPDSAATSIGWPVADGTSVIAKNPISNKIDVSGNAKNGWTVRADYLPSDATMTIEFDCVAMEEVNGVEVQNQVKAVADNSPKDEDGNTIPSWDDAKVYTNTVDLAIDKSASQHEWQVGDDVEYTIVVKHDDYISGGDPDDLTSERTHEGTIARNVLIKDIEIPEGLEFKGIDSVVVNGVPVQITDKVHGPADIANQLDETLYNQTEVKDNQYTVTQNGNGFQVAIPNLPYGEEVTITFPCTATAVAEGTNGWEWINKASVEADNQRGHEKQEDDAEVYINTANLAIDKYQVNNNYNGSQDASGSLGQNFEDGTNSLGNVAYKATGAEGTHSGNTSDNGPVADSSNSGEVVTTTTTTTTTTYGDDSEGTLTPDESIFAPKTEGEYDNRYYYEYRVGETVEYKVVLQNTQKNSVARNVVVQDVTLPKGLSLAEGDFITVEGFQEKWNNPISGTVDPTNQLDVGYYNEFETLDFNYEVSKVTNEDGSTGFTVTIPNLPCTTGDKLNPNWTSPIVITYHCVVGEDINGSEVINTAKVTADNATPKQDKEVIWVNSPEFSVVKQADRDHYKLNDTITYEVTATNINRGTLARNVVLFDELLTEGVKLQKSTIVLMDGTGRVIDDDDYEVEIFNDHFVVRTLRDMYCSNGNYYIYDLDENSGYTDGGIYNPMMKPENVPNGSHDKGYVGSLKLEYQVQAIDHALAGKTIKNKITVNSDENIPKDDTEEVPINGPSLNIEKTSDKEQYYVGETGIYKLVVTNLREDVVAENVVITDELKVDGAVIVGNPIIEFNNAEFEPVSIDKTDKGFVIKTGKNLTDADKLEVVYKVLFKDPSLDGKKVNNTAIAKGDNTPEEKQDNVVKVTDKVPKLTIEKHSDKKEYAVGETGHYSVKVTQPTEDAVARNVIIKDELMVDGAKIIPSTVKIQNSRGIVLDIPEIEATEKGYTIHTGADLQYDDYFLVTYDVLFESETLSGQNIINIARATSDNAKAEAKNDVTTPITVGDGLTALKTCNPANNSVVKNGGTITYSITVENSTDKDKTNVLVKDKIPTLTKFVGFVGAENATVNAAGQTELPNGILAQLQKLNGSDHATFIIGTLPAKSSRTVSFNVSVDGAKEDDMIVNIAQVRDTIAESDNISEQTWLSDRFRNTNETVHFLDTDWVSDSEIVEVKEAGLTITKTSDKPVYNVGDTGVYTLTVGNTAKGSVANNVVVSDKLNTKGAEIVSDSIEVKDVDGNVVKDVKVTSDKQSFTVETGLSVPYGKVITVTYNVLFKDKSLEGTKVKNVAVAKDDDPNTEDPSTEHEVDVEKATLKVVKESDKYEYEVGETAKYTVIVTNEDKDNPAKNVVITDEMMSSGIELDVGSIEIKDQDGQLVTSAVVTKLDSDFTGFKIETNRDLAYGEKLVITYKATMKDETLVGHEVRNIVTVKGDNVDPVTDDNKVIIVGGETPKPTPKPTEKPEEPSETPVPSTPTPTDPPKKTTTTTTTTTTTSGTPTGTTGTTTVSGGKTVTAGKTGDTRPLVAVGIVALIAAGGAVYGFKNSKKGSKKPTDGESK